MAEEMVLERGFEDDDDVYGLAFLYEDAPASPESKIRAWGQAVNNPHTLQVVVPAEAPSALRLYTFCLPFEKTKRLTTCLGQEREQGRVLHTSAFSDTTWPRNTRVLS